MSKKNLIIIVIAIILIIIGIVILNNNKKQDNTSKEQVSETIVNPITQKKTNGIYEMYNTNIKTNTGFTIIKATVKNISGNKTSEQIIDIVLLNKDAEEIGIIKTTIPSLETGSATQIEAESIKVYENIYDFRIK